MRTVEDILRSKPEIYNCIPPTTLVIDALTMLNSINLSYLIVKDEDSYKGLFCERDYSRNVILKGRSSRDTPVSEVMTIDLPMVDIKDSVGHCMDTMNLYKTRYVLAFDDNQFRGVITIHDLFREMIRHRDLVDKAVAEDLIAQDER